MRLAYVVGTYPQPSETFIAREIAGLRARGHAVDLFSLYAPETGPADGVTYGYPNSAARLLRKVTGLSPLARRWRRAFAAGGYAALVAHFGSQPSTVALEAAGDLPLVLSLHARDLYVEAECLAEKIAHATVVVTCTRANVDYLRDRFPAHAGKIHLVYHGLPASWLDSPVPERRRDANEPLRVLAVGRLVEKKGFDGLLRALPQLNELGYRFTVRLIGDGPLRAPLAEVIREWWGASGTVTLAGWTDEAGVRAAYAWADVFCCPSIITADGDRDGLPNVLVEAMATGLPAIGSAISGIPEAIEDGVTGLLVPPNDAQALRLALARLTDPALRAVLGAAATARVRDRFNGERWLDVLEKLLRR